MGKAGDPDAGYTEAYGRDYTNGYEIVRPTEGPSGQAQPTPAKSNAPREPGTDSSHSGAGTSTTPTHTSESNAGSITPPPGIHPVAKKTA